jgi:flagellar biosynthetic protein FliR
MFLAALPLRLPGGVDGGVGSGDLNSQIVSVFGTSSQLWITGLIFLRLASLVMLVPGMGDQSVPPRLRLGFALLLALALSPLVGHTLPPMPATLGGMTGVIFHEVLIGLMLGTLMRVLLFTLTTSGEIISLHSGISFAQTANPAEAQPSSSIGSFLAMLGLVLVWSTDMHHLFIRAMVDSFSIFPATKPIMYADGATLMVRTLGETFTLAMQMAAPIIVFSLIFNIATGFVARIMPNFPVFFAATPLSLMVSLALLALGLGGMGMAFLNHYQDLMAIFVRGPHG